MTHINQDQHATLLSLRQEIDTVDNQIHDLIMRRVQIVEHIGRLKAKEKGLAQSSFAMCPVRETEIIRGLWNRHKGPLGKEIIVRLWRELISACTNLQTPMTVAVYMPERGMGNLEIARNYFGSYTPMISCRSENLVLKELMHGEANIAVLSLNEDTQSCWWYSVAQEYKRTLMVFAKLPLTHSGISDNKIAYALGKVDFEKTNDAQTLLVAETDGSLSLSTLDLLLKASGIPTNAICDTYIPDFTRKAYLFEIEGYLSEDDERLNSLIDKENGRIIILRVIGGYPILML